MTTPSAPAVLPLFQPPGAEPMTLTGSDGLPSRAEVELMLPLAWDRDRLVITEEKAAKKLAKPYMSASTMNALASCGARWAIEQLLPRHEEAFGAAELGSSAHSALEDLFALPGAMRTPARLDAIIEKLHASHANELALPLDADLERWRDEVRLRASGIFQIEDPTVVQVAATEMNLDGVEVAGVPIKGYIDRVDIGANEAGVLGRKVIDYKAGKYKAPNPRFYDGYGEQLRTYTLALTVVDNGIKPVSADLYYVKAGKVVNVNLSAGAMRKTEQNLQAGWADLKYWSGEAAFPAKSSALCGWCPLATVCPVAKKDGKDEAKIPSSTLGESLNIPVIHSLTTVSVAVSADVDDFDYRQSDAPRQTLNGYLRAPGEPDYENEGIDYDPALDFAVPAVDRPDRIADPLDLDAFGKPANINDELHRDDDSIAEYVPADALWSEVDPAAVAIPEDTTTTPEPTAASAVQDPWGPFSTATDEGAASDETSPESNGIDQVTERHTEQEAGKTMARWSEDKPWEETNSEGRLNPNSYSAIAAFGTAAMAVEHLAKGDQPVTGPNVRALAQTFAGIVQGAQNELSGHTSMQDGLNTRLRGALYAVIAATPIPWGQDATAWETWVAQATKRIKAIATVAEELWTDDARIDVPWMSLAS